MTPEQIQQWLAAKDCWFEFSEDEKHWTEPQRLLNYFESPNTGDRMFESTRPNNYGWYYCRPSRAPGVLVVHDGSDEKPEWVPYDADLYIVEHGFSYGVAGEIARAGGIVTTNGRSVAWEAVRKFMWRQE